LELEKKLDDQNAKQFISDLQSSVTAHKTVVLECRKFLSEFSE